MAQKFIAAFDQKIPKFYSEQDRATGSFTGEDRFGVKREFEIMTVSISIICSEMSNYESATEISHECAKMKEHLKKLPGSNYMIDTVGDDLRIEQVRLAIERTDDFIEQAQSGLNNAKVFLYYLF